MASAFLWALLAASSLVVGGLLAVWLDVGRRALGLVMAFGAGVLISAVAYELVEEAADTTDGAAVLACGLAAGALVFFAGDEVISRSGGAGRKRSDGRQADGIALAIVLGIVVDGIPESVVIGAGLTRGEGVGAAVVAAVFLSNVPEAVAATTGLRAAGHRPRNILGLWALVAVASGLASALGYAALEGAGPGALAFVLTFTGGAVLTMLAETMMPEAFEDAGRAVGLVTTLGFALAFGLSLAG